METISPTILKRRAAVESWKRRNYEYYLLQKRFLSHRPEYLAHRRDIYKQKVENEKALGKLPKRRGQPPKQPMRSHDDFIFSTSKNDESKSSTECENTD